MRIFDYQPKKIQKVSSYLTCREKIKFQPTLLTPILEDVEYWDAMIFYPTKSQSYNNNNA